MAQVKQGQDFLKIELDMTCIFAKEAKKVLLN